MAAGISGNLCGFLEFLGVEVVLEALDILIVAGGDLSQQANGSI